ncbi:MAG: ribosome biogenesis GTPase YlqF [Enterocloster sp.]
MNIQWYPGHMTKAKRAMKEDMKLIDLVIELVDARVPFSSRNPDIDELAAGKARMVLLNKSDLADEAANAAWASLFESKKIHVVKIDARNKGTLKQVQSVVQEACKEKIERDRKRGILNRPIRTMVVGIPNVGKSTFINSFAGKACAKTGNKPGVTKGNQWIRLNKTLELLDTPGILWPRFEDQQVGLHLALIGSINDQILNRDELACELIRLLEKEYPGILFERFGIGSPKNEDADAEAAGMPKTADNTGSDPAQILEQIAGKRACLLKGGELDLSRAASLLLDDFRSGRLGRITLEKTEDYGSRIK